MATEYVTVYGQHPQWTLVFRTRDDARTWMTYRKVEIDFEGMGVAALARQMNEIASTMSEGVITKEYEGEDDTLYSVFYAEGWVPSKEGEAALATFHWFEGNTSKIFKRP